MRAELAAAAAVIVAAVGGVRYWETRSQAAPGASAESMQALTRPANAANVSASPSPYDRGWGEEVRISAAADNQYYVTAAVNNSPAPFLVDTGAGYVALRESDARKAGIYPNWNDFTQSVRTANGETKAAFVTLREIEINGIRVDNVKAFVLADEQLGINLLGMSFLSRLESVEARGGELVLKGG